MAKTKKKPTGDPGKWVTIKESMRRTGLTRSGVEYAARAGRVRRKKFDGKYMFSGTDSTAYRQGKNGASKTNGKPGSSTDQPAYMKDITTGRMKPKAAQTAVQKARWVFEGLDMGNLDATNALNIIRTAMYEGTN